MNKLTRSMVIQQLLVIFGVLLNAVSFNIFFITNHIAPGGVSGIATLFNALFGLPVGAMILIMNIPLFIAGLRIKGIGFTLRTLLNTFLLSVFIDYLPIPERVIQSLGSDPILATVYGGLLLGVGMGLIFQGNSTTGGTDIIAAILHHYFPNLRIPWALFMVDFCVVVAAGIVLEPKLALYALAVIFISTKVSDFVQVGLNSSRAFFIISSKANVIAMRIINELQRGVTSLDGRGIYSGQSCHVLLCIVSRNEITRLKKIVRDEDLQAFVVMTNVSEVLGEGFSSLSVSK